MTEPLPRKLRVILHADIVGYSRLASVDEDATHRRLKESLSLIDSLVITYHGHVVNTAGDAVLAVFDAVVDASSCALAIQNEIATRNQDLSDDSKVLFRIGINLGDVIEDGGNVYGDGVNVAARLEGLAEPGGVCVSEQVYKAVGSKLALDFHDMGAQSVKNIAEPVQAYSVQLSTGAHLPRPSERHEPTGAGLSRKTWVAMLVVLLAIGGGVLSWLKPWQSREEPTSGYRMDYPLPDKPSIAVLPFQNLSGGGQKKYFVDGVTEDIITMLSRFSELFVIAKRSSFRYRDKDVSVRQIGKELGVQYVLEGSIRHSETEAIVTVQLVDASTGTNVWTERYQEQLTNVFEIQENILESIISTVTDRIENFELRLAENKDTKNLNAYDLVLRGYAQFPKWTKESFWMARKYFHDAIKLDPNYARAYAGIGFTHNIDFSRNWGEDPTESLALAREMSLKAIELDDKDNRPRVVLGWVYINSGEIDRGIAELKKGIKLNPNDANVLARSGYALTYYGEFQQAIDQVNRAMRINPFHPSYYYDVLAWAQYFLQQYDEALKTLENVPEPNISHLLTLAAASARIGNSEEARAYAQRILEKNPEFKLDNYRKSRPFKHAEHIEFHLESLRMAGLR